MIDLFRLEQQQKRHHYKPVSAALVEVEKTLKTHSAVAYCEPMNNAAACMCVAKISTRLIGTQNT